MHNKHYIVLKSDEIYSYEDVLSTVNTFIIDNMEKTSCDYFSICGISAFPAYKDLTKELEDEYSAFIVANGAKYIHGEGRFSTDSLEEANAVIRSEVDKHRVMPANVKAMLYKMSQAERLDAAELYKEELYGLYDVKHFIEGYMVSHGHFIDEFDIQNYDEYHEYHFGEVGVTLSDRTWFPEQGKDDCPVAYLVTIDFHS